ncbi:hypothetical protein [Spirochaeta dissipatitropha]
MSRTDFSVDFNVKRLCWLTYNRVLADLPVALITAGVVIGLNLVSLMLVKEVPINTIGPQGYQGISWGIGIFLLGLYFAGRGFRDMHGAEGTEWILLPASRLEKFISTLLWLYILWPLASASAAVGGSALLYGLQAVGGTAAGSIWLPFNRTGLQLLLSWWTIIPLFIAGSAAFRKHAIIKTLGVSTLVFLGLVMIITPLFRILLAGREFTGTLQLINGKFIVSGNDVLNSRLNILQLLLDFWRFVAFPGCALLFTYFRISEKEGADAVQ